MLFPSMFSVSTRFVCLSLIAFALSACGGGGGGGGGSSSSGLNTAAVTRENSSQLADVLISYLYIGSASSSRLYYLQYLLADRDIEEGNFNEQLPCFSGSASISGNVSQSGTGTIHQTYDNCRMYNDSYITLNGRSSLIIHAANDDEEAIDYSLEFEQYEYRSDDNQTFRYDGELRIETQVADGLSRATVNLQLRDLTANTYIVTEGLQYDFPIRSLQLAEGIENLTGKIGHSSYGLVDASIDNDTGQLYLTGSESSSLQITIDWAFFQVVLALDSNGDASYDAFLDASIYDLENEPTTENTSPQFVGSTTLEGQRDTQIELDLLYNTVDDDRDFLDFAIALQSSPADSEIDLELFEGRYLQFQADVAGDYIVDLTISDARGGDITVPVELHLLRSPPELAVSEYDTTVSVSDELQLSLAPVNPEEGPYTYTLKAAPPGMVVDSNGDLTWIPADSELYFPATEFNALVEISNDDHAIEVPITVRVDDASVEIPLVRSSIKVPTKEQNIHVGDFDDDGNQEVLMTNNGNLIYTVEWNGSDYVQDWVFPYEMSGEGSIDHIFPWDDDGDGLYEIYVQKGTQVHVIEEGLATSRFLFDIGELSGNANSDGNGIGYGLTIADLDNDSVPELIVLATSGYYASTGHVLVTNLAGTELLWSVNNIDLGRSMAVANVDADVALELVFAGGYVYDGATHSNQWLYSSDFGQVVVAGDIDGDGIAEIIAGRQYDTVAVYSAVNKSLEYDINQSNVCSMTLLPLDGDADMELVAAGCYGGILAWDGSASAATELWSLTGAPEAQSLAHGDSDDDGNSEMIWAGDWSSSSNNILVVMNTATQMLEYESPNQEQLQGPFYGGYAITDGVSEERVLFAVAQSGYYDGGRLIALDESTATFIVSDELGNYSGSSPGINVSDYDLDGVDEVIYSLRGSSFDDGFVVYDFFSDIEEWSRNDSSASFGQIATGLLNDDVYTDFAIVESRSIELYDGYNQTLMWSSAQFNYSPKDILIHDLDGDGLAEILLLFNDRLQVYRRSGASYTESESYAFQDNSPMQLLVDEIDGTGRPELLVLMGNSYYNSTLETELVVLDDSLTQLKTVAISGRVSSIASTGNADGTLFAAISQPEQMDSYSYYGDWPDRVQLVSLDAGQVIWRSPPVLGDISQHGLRIIGDGATKRLAIGTRNAMYITR